MSAEDVWDDAAILTAFETGISLHDKNAETVSSKSSPWYMREDVDLVLPDAGEEIGEEDEVSDHEAKKWRTISFDREVEGEDDEINTFPSSSNTVDENTRASRSPPATTDLPREVNKKAPESLPSKVRNSTKEEKRRMHQLHAKPSANSSYPAATNLPGHGAQYNRVPSMPRGPNPSPSNQIPPSNLRPPFPTRTALEQMEEEELSSMLWAWYSAGYQTGRFQALRELRQRQNNTQQ